MYLSESWTDDEIDYQLRTSDIADYRIYENIMELQYKFLRYVDDHIKDCQNNLDILNKNEIDIKYNKFEYIELLHRRTGSIKVEFEILSDISLEEIQNKIDSVVNVCRHIINYYDIELCIFKYLSKGMYYAIGEDVKIKELN